MPHNPANHKSTLDISPSPQIRGVLDTPGVTAAA
jgi:hypothetical protein